MIDNDVDLVVHVGDLSYANGDPEVSFDYIVETKLYYCAHSLLKCITESCAVQTCFQVTDRPTFHQHCDMFAGHVLHL